MHQSYFVIPMPSLSDEQVAQIHDFLGELVNTFESQYWSQLHRHYDAIAKAQQQHDLNQEDEMPF